MRICCEYGASYFLLKIYDFFKYFISSVSCNICDILFIFYFNTCSTFRLSNLILRVITCINKCNIFQCLKNILHIVTFLGNFFPTIRHTFNLLKWIQDSSHLFKTHKTTKNAQVGLVTFWLGLNKMLSYKELWINVNTLKTFNGIICSMTTFSI